MIEKLNILICEILEPNQTKSNVLTCFEPNLVDKSSHKPFFYTWFINVTAGLLMYQAAVAIDYFWLLFHQMKSVYSVFTIYSFLVQY